MWEVWITYKGECARAARFPYYHIAVGFFNRQEEAILIKVK